MTDRNWLHNLDNGDQCDQITIQALAIYNNDNLPHNIKMPKLEQKFGKY